MVRRLERVCGIYDFKEENKEVIGASKKGNSNTGRFSPIRAEAYMTCAVVASTPSEIVIAVDNKRQFADKSGEINLCKIFQIRHIFGVASGYVSNEQGYEIQEVVKGAYRLGMTIRDLAYASRDALMPMLRDDVAALMKNNPQVFEQYFRNTDTADIVLVGFENGRREIYKVVFRPVIKNGVLEMNGGIGKPEENFFCDMLGAYDYINDQREPTAEVWGNGLAEGAQRLVETQASKDPLIGKGVNVLRITTSGAEWINNTECQAIENYWQRKEKPNKGASKTRKKRRR